MLSLLFVLVLLAASPAQAERNTLCDDGGPLDVTCTVSLPTLGDFMCGSDGLVALQAGCYLCVDVTTCTDLGSLKLNAEEQGNSLPLPKANGNDISVLLQDQADNKPEESAFEQAAAINANLAGNSPGAEDIAENSVKPPEVSNWLFSIPVCLAVISLGLAIRARVPSRSGFQRLQDHRSQANPLFQDNINPFCDTEFDEDFSVETAGHFQGDPSNSESEEAQFLPSTELEDDEFTKAESEAIKQAVLLHIKEFDEHEEEEVEI